MLTEGLEVPANECGLGGQAEGSSSTDKFKALQLGPIRVAVLVADDTKVRTP